MQGQDDHSFELDTGAEHTQPTELDGRKSTSLTAALDNLRKQLIDLGTRNRLIHTPIKSRSARQLRIVDELSDEVFKILEAGKTMTFDPALQDPSPENEAEEDEDHVYVPTDEDDTEGPAARHIDSKLQTDLTAEALQKRLLSIFREARTLEEEQGVSVLFIALGFLCWYESPSSDIERFAPLILYPVDLVRDKARGRFKLRARDEEMEVNLSLMSRLKNDFALSLPEFPAHDGWLPSDYFAQVQELADSQPRWRIEPNTMQIGFFSFAKFRMWQDISESTEWPEGLGPFDNALLDKLLVGGFESAGRVTDDDANLDREFPDLRDLGHILDADSSQAQVIAAAANGENLVVQGPPGTGKSQTIANIIAVAAGQGKRVLFVSEKRAALDVVHDRLDRAGLAPMCLELHSHKANRKQVYEDLRKTLDLSPQNLTSEQDFDRAQETRDELNRLSDLLHQLDPQTEQTAYLAMGGVSEILERGVPDPGFTIEGADTWNAEAFEARMAITRELAELTSRHGPEHHHAWRGVRNRLSPLDRQRFEKDLDLAITAITELQSICAKTEDLTGMSPESPFADIDKAVNALRAMEGTPSCVRELIERDELITRTAQVQALAAQTVKSQELKSQLDQEVVDTALRLAWEETRIAVAAHGERFWKIFNGDYRRAIARMKGVHKAKLPKSQSALLDILDRLIEYGQLSQSIASKQALGSAAFGVDWNGEETDMTEFMPAVSWIKEQSDLRESSETLRAQVRRLEDIGDPMQLRETLEQCRNDWEVRWPRVEQALGLDVSIAYNRDTLAEVSLTEMASRLADWHRHPTLLEGWHLLSAKARQASELGLEPLRGRLAGGHLEPTLAEDALAFIRAEAVWKHLCGLHPEIEAISGDKRTHLVEEFKKLDQKLLDLSAIIVASKHREELPMGSSGQIGIVRGEASKKTRHMKIRRLLSTAGEAVVAIKPIFLMSPMSVAQFLQPGSIRFDLLLIDEASQVKPSDAIGAICRAEQIVVVGDQKQMPPSSFFDRQTSNAEDDQEDEDADALVASQIADMESILSLCDARAMRGGTLRWHYRSKHESLIAVSNDEFYNNKLICPPSPESRSTEMGFSLTRVDGHFERGKGRNPAEAEAVAEAVLDHARERPNETLGVVAMSVAQRNTIENKIELLRTEYPELDAFCAEGKEEAFFVKNLENVQGDERDAIFVSIGYGRDDSGFMSNNFGPVSKAGGERRLNVLFTRAKLRCRLFSSMLHTDVRIEATQSEGARVLKRFLKYAQTGELDLPMPTGQGMDSPFEEAVALALHKHGHKVSAQVGSKGFRIDLAVHDPDCEGRFLLAVECDGARYHSSSWARERDRLRQTVLEGIGWKFHRIWSTDWFYNRDVEIQKLLEAIARARTVSQDPRVASAPTPARQERLQQLVTTVSEEPNSSPRTYYVEAEFDPYDGGPKVPIHEMSSHQLQQNVRRIVAEEGPIHMMEVARRLTKLGGLNRTGSHIQEQVQRAIQASIRSEDLRWAEAGNGEFVVTANAPERPEVRDRSLADTTLRRPDRLPPSEVRQAILIAARQNVALTAREAATEVARQLGFSRTRKSLAEYIEAHVRSLVESGELSENSGQFRLSSIQ